MKITVEVEVTADRLKNLLCCACEGGSNYWIASVERPPKKTWPKPSEYWHEIPVYGGEITFVVDQTDGEPVEGGGFRYTLDRLKLEKGLKLMAAEHPLHWGDFIQEQEDATTGDVFLQLCLFDDVIYG